MDMNLEEMMIKAETQLCHLSDEQRMLYDKFTKMAKEGKRPTFKESCQLQKLFKDLMKFNKSAQVAKDEAAL